VRDGLMELVAKTGADELMVTTNIHSPDARVESYRLLAEAMGMTARRDDEVAVSR
jgi:hypothetical protein